MRALQAATILRLAAFGRRRMREFVGLGLGREARLGRQIPAIRSRGWQGDN